MTILASNRITLIERKYFMDSHIQNMVDLIKSPKPWDSTPGGYAVWKQKQGQKPITELKIKDTGRQLPELSKEDAAFVRDIVRRHCETHETTYKEYCIEFDAFWNARGVDWL